MSEWDHVAKFKPAAPPFLERTREAALYKPYVACWINPRNEVCPLGTAHTRRAAERACRNSMRDNCDPVVNHHTRFYIWDSSLPWNPESLHAWTPIAERPRDQWVLSL